MKNPERDDDDLPKLEGAPDFSFEHKFILTIGTDARDSLTLNTRRIGNIIGDAPTSLGS